MHALRIILLLISSLLAHVSADEIIISAERIGQNIESSTRPIKIIDKKTLKDKNITSFSQIAGLYSGLQSSSSSSSNSFFIRGGENHHILYIVDDIIYNDTTNPNHGFDFSKINIGDVERIEIIKGPESILYGGDALSGVIKIYTKKFKKLISASLETSPQYYDAKLQNSGVLHDQLKYQFSLNHSRDKRYSDAAARLNPNAEKDLKLHTQGNIRLEQTIGLNHLIGASFTLIDHKQDIDNDTYDDSKSSSNYSQRIGKAEYHFTNEDQTNEQSFFISRNSIKRHEIGATYNSFYSGHHDQYDYLNLLKIENKHKITFGTQINIEKASINEGKEFTKQLINIGTFVNDQISFHKFILSLGVRAEHTKINGISPSYKLGMSFPLTTILTYKANFGTGIKTPNIYQLYSLYGNSQLQPEKSQNIDTEFILNFSNNTKTSLGLFQNTYLKNINYSFTTQKYENLSKTRTQGLEFELGHQFNNFILLKTNYTYLDSYDFQNKRRLTRRARHIINADIDLIIKKFSLNFSGQYVGRRLDYFRNNYLENDSYTLYNAIINYKINSISSITLSINNILNHSYEAILGHESPDRTFLLKGEIIF